MNTPIANPRFFGENHCEINLTPAEKSHPANTPMHAWKMMPTAIELASPNRIMNPPATNSEHERTTRPPIQSVRTPPEALEIT